MRMVASRSALRLPSATSGAMLGWNHEDADLSLPLDELVRVSLGHAKEVLPVIDHFIDEQAGIGNLHEELHGRGKQLVSAMTLRRDLSKCLLNDFRPEFLTEV